MNVYIFLNFLGRGIRGEGNGRKEKVKTEKRMVKRMQSFCKQRRKGIERRGGKQEKRGINIYRVPVQIPYDECDRYISIYISLNCTNKLNLKIR